MFENGGEVLQFGKRIFNSHKKVRAGSHLVCIPYSFKALNCGSL